MVSVGAKEAEFDVPSPKTLLLGLWGSCQMRHVNSAADPMQKPENSEIGNTLRRALAIFLLL